MTPANDSLAFTGEESEGFPNVWRSARALATAVPKLWPAMTILLGEIESGGEVK